MIYREFVLSSPSIWSLIVAFVKSNATACIKQGKPLHVFITTQEKKRSSKQNSRYWGYVLKTIAEQSWVNGKQYRADTWHEYLGDMYLPKIEKELPDGSIKTHRVSTTDLSVSEFTEYMQNIEAYAASELGVVWE